MLWGSGEDCRLSYLGVNTAAVGAAGKYFGVNGEKVSVKAVSRRHYVLSLLKNSTRDDGACLTNVFSPRPHSAGTSDTQKPVTMYLGTASGGSCFGAEREVATDLVSPPQGDTGREEGAD